MDDPTESVDIKRVDSEKKKMTRRRLRLSCVGCTKQRQKCDRSYPCSLCVTRGVSHLCRWDSVPMARPTPAVPPDALIRAPMLQNLQIRELNSRITSLERASSYLMQSPSNKGCSRNQKSNQSNGPPSAQDQSSTHGHAPLSPTVHAADQIHNTLSLDSNLKPQIEAIPDAAHHQLPLQGHTTHRPQPHPAPLQLDLLNEKHPIGIASSDLSLSFGNASSTNIQGVVLNTADDANNTTSLYSHPSHPLTIVTSSNAASDLMRTSFPPEPLAGSHGHGQFRGIHRTTTDAVTSDDVARAVPILLAKPLNQELYDNTSTLAQLSLAHHGEFIGRGSITCALHSISDGQTPRFLYAKSTDISTHTQPNSLSFLVSSLLGPHHDQLLRNVPSPAVTSAILYAYFSDVKGRFGIPDSDKDVNKCGSPRNTLLLILATSALIRIGSLSSLQFSP